MKNPTTTFEVTITTWTDGAIDKTATTYICTDPDTAYKLFTTLTNWAEESQHTTVYVEVQSRTKDKAPE